MAEDTVKSLNEHRLSQNPLEQIYLEEWKKIRSRNLPYILEGNRPTYEFTERDEVVAATVIQWLGSPVGQGFVRTVLDRAKEEGVCHE